MAGVLILQGVASEGFRFACQDCGDTNQPFTIDETAGFKMRLSHANLASDGEALSFYR